MGEPKKVEEILKKLLGEGMLIDLNRAEVVFRDTWERTLLQSYTDLLIPQASLISQAYKIESQILL